MLISEYESLNHYWIIIGFSGTMNVFPLLMEPSLVFSSVRVFIVVLSILLSARCAHARALWAKIFLVPISNLFC